ncbi:MAG: substrate-binding domain-containing protein [Planctomycetota bacterium]
MRAKRVVWALLVLAAACGTGAAGQDRLRVYCVYHTAHGLKAIGREYQKKTGVGLELRRHCRERFDPTAKRLKGGDLFLTTDPQLFEKATERGLLATEPRRIGSVTPVIVVAEGNPHGIQSLADLGRKGLTVAYPSTCIGNVSLAVIAKNHLNADVKPNMTIRTGNRTGVLKALVNGKAQAALTWSCAVVESGRKNLDVVAIPADQNIIDPILVAVLKSAKNQARAQALIDYLGTEPVRERLRAFRLLETKPDETG